MSGAPRRTWPQRLLLGLNIVVIGACFVGAGGLVAAHALGGSLSKVTLADPSGTIADPATSTGATTASGGSSTVPVNTVTGETLPEIDPGAMNFLITGADNNACIPPDSPYAGAFGDRSNGGERSDTIMIMRVDPETKQAALLSFPRDLWVRIAGRNSDQRINTAYVRNDPQRLIDTIYQNFGVGVDHFVQIDFCAFRTIVDGLNGVKVPFEFPARDDNTGLNVPEAGCFNFDGDHALAYVRSRHYEYQGANGKWKEDPASDYGRVARQQDFLRRVISAALDRGVTDPSVARSLIKAAQDNVVVDDELTIDKMLQLAGVLRNFDPGGIASYRIEGVGQMIRGNSVIVPKLNTTNMQAVLAIFKGEAPLAGAPITVPDTTTPPTTSPTTSPTTTPSTTPGTSTPTTVPATTPSTVVPPEENVKGIVPPRDVQC